MTIANFRTDGPIGGRTPRVDATAARPTTRLAPVPTEPELDWMKKSFCANSDDPNAWFPTGNTGVWLQRIEDTKALCRNACPVMAECERLLKHLESHGEVAGIWAGLSEEDRTGNRMREKRRLAKKRYAEKQRAAA
jgi:WhiB family transcriptional regulator, redox-sensing transcriptional regulator